LQPHERIAASAIYYYERDDSVEDAGACAERAMPSPILILHWSGLYLRRKRDGEDFPSYEENDRGVRARRLAAEL
jgi:hypothetical protein